MNRPYVESRTRFQFPHEEEARGIPFCEVNPISMQAVGSTENTGLSRQDRVRAWRELVVEPIGIPSVRWKLNCIHV